MSSKQNLVKTFFSGYAGKWDSLYGKKTRKDPFSKFADEVLRKVIKRRFQETLILIDKHECFSILDVGCGSGRYLVEFAKRGRYSHGIDFAQPMLDLAQASIEFLSLQSMVKLECSTWRDFETNRSFDAIVAIGFFDYQENPKEALSKMISVSEKLVIASFPRSNGLLAFQRRIRYRIRKCPLWMYSQSQIENMMLEINPELEYEILNLGRDFLLNVRMN